MENEWATINLGDVIEIKYGKDHKKLKDGPIPCFGSGGVMRYVSDYLYDDESILIPRKGSLNNIYYLNEPFWTVDTLFWSKINKAIADPKFIFYQLKLIDFNKLNEGSAVPSLTVPILNNIKLKLPSIKIQSEISQILSELDKKIEVNIQTNQTLEQMAQALFKSWFVDFDPVIDNALAAGNHIPDELQARAELRQRVIAERATNPKLKPLPDDIQQMFPSEFEHCGDVTLGIKAWIPKGWDVTSFESLISLIGGGTPKTTIDDYWGGDIPWFSVVDAPNDSDVFVIETEKHVTQLGVDKSSTKILREGTTIISARGTVGKCALVGSPMAMNQSCYGIVGKFKNHDEYIYFLTRYQVSDLQKRGHGSVFNTITRETFKSISLAKSGDLLTQKFSEIVRPYLAKILSNNKQNIELTKLRDVLLPKLISGELII
jgi:type I restriction enzyme S subunit